MFGSVNLYLQVQALAIPFLFAKLAVFDLVVMDDDLTVQDSVDVYLVAGEALALPLNVELGKLSHAIRF